MVKKKMNRKYSNIKEKKKEKLEEIGEKSIPKDIKH